MELLLVSFTTDLFMHMHYIQTLYVLQGSLIYFRERLTSALGALFKQLKVVTFA